MKLFALSGSHGTGKSTILHLVQSTGFNIDETALSRTAQKKLGWDKLSIAGESVSNMWALQNAVLDALIERDSNILNKQPHTDTVLVERSPLDILAYTKMWCNALNISTESSEVLSFKNRCIEALASYTHVFIVPISTKIQFVVDPHRASEDTRVFVEDEIFNVVTTNTVSTSLISAVDKHERKQQIIDVLNLYKVT